MSVKIKRLFIILLCFACAIGALTLTACTPDKQDDYVEVTALRVAEPNIYLSSTGDTSTYRLEVEILPANATNRKLEYHVPSSCAAYVTVSDSGLVAARKITEKDSPVPITVTSTTNKNASVVVNATVEDVAVKTITFAQSSITFTMGDEPRAVGVNFEPTHAVDGRTVKYESLDPSVATVNSTSGVIAPVSVGTTHITATGTTQDGVNIIGRMEVAVRYAESRYKLEVSENPPPYKQTVNDHSSIHFTLVLLGDGGNVYDPKPTIKWYNDSVRVESCDDNLQYAHTPDVNSKTSYKIKAVVTPKGQDSIELFSEMIEIYEEFTGFDLKVYNSETEYVSYNYLQNVEFNVNSSSDGVSAFDWYLKKFGATGEGEKVATTLVSDKNLTKKLNLDGEYELKIIGRNAAGDAVVTETKRFNVVRYKVGDTVVIAPVVRNNGLPPESYDWFKYPCSADGTLTGEKEIRIGQGTSARQKFNYTFTQSEYFLIGAKATLRGTGAVVDGTEFVIYTPIVYVCAANYVEEPQADYISAAAVTEGNGYSSEINYVVIDGKLNADIYYPTITWNNVSEANNFIVEITGANGLITIMDSTNSAYNAYFDGSSCVVPAEVAGLSDKFSVRIKQKGGVFSERYYYGFTPGYDDDKTLYYASVPTSHYSLMKTYEKNKNTYLRTMREVGEWLDYITLYEPTQNTVVTYSTDSKDGNSYNIFTTKVYFDFNYSDYADYYYVSQSFSGVGEAFVTPYKIIVAAHNAYCDSGYAPYSLRMSYDETLKIYTVELWLTSGDRTLKSTESVSLTVLDGVNYSSSPYGANNKSFAIDSRSAVSVTTTDQLYSAVEAGYKPHCTTTVTVAVYEAAKNIINTIIGAEMTDREKITAIYDYLTTNVSYDKKVLEIFGIGSTDAYIYDSFHLEGVFFNKKAVCDGIAKAFVVLCGIEGIASCRVTGVIGSTGHAWNKVYCDGAWRITDATWGALKDENLAYQYSNHTYLFMTDAQFKTLYTTVSETDGGDVIPVIEGEFPEAQVEYDYYANNFVNGKDLYIESAEELTALINSFGTTVEKDVLIEVKLSGEITDKQAFVEAVSRNVSGNKAIEDIRVNAKGSLYFRLTNKI